jgi:hypothetical protein
MFIFHLKVPKKFFYVEPNVCIGSLSTSMAMCFGFDFNRKIPRDPLIKQLNQKDLVLCYPFYKNVIRFKPFNISIKGLKESAPNLFPGTLSLPG